METKASDARLEQIVLEATTRAKLKNARLKKLKERNELYLRNRWNEIGVEDDGGVDSDETTPELQGSTPTGRQESNPACPLNHSSSCSERLAALSTETRIRRIHRTATRTGAKRGRRCRLVGRAHCVLEVLDRAAHAGAELRQAIGPENDNHNDEDYEQFWQSDATHGDTPPVPDRPEEIDW